MNAKEARAKAEAKNTNDTNSQYAEIKSKIEKAAENGAYEVWIHDNVKPDVKTKLEQEGFKVKDCSDNIRNEPGYQITW